MSAKIKIRYRKKVGGRIHTRTVETPDDWTNETSYQEMWAELRIRRISKKYIYCGFQEV